MSLRTINWRTISVAVTAATLLVGCTSTLVEDVKRPVPTKVAHCEGSETVNDSSIAILPIPIVAFFVPHMDVNEIRADDYVKRCGDQRNLVNRKVEVSRTACVPAGLTRFLTLGIWQWCPASVSWDADILETPPGTSKASE